MAGAGGVVERDFAAGFGVAVLVDDGAGVLGGDDDAPVFVFCADVVALLEIGGGLGRMGKHVAAGAAMAARSRVGAG